jgi:pyruvate formate lyase activating enzyme
VELLERAAAIGRQAGLRYVYAGNLPGRVGELEDTRCPNCRTVLVERFGFEVIQNRITAAGACSRCHTAIPGFWRAGATRAMQSAGEVPIGGG